MGPPDVAGSRRGKDEPPTVRDKRFPAERTAVSRSRIEPGPAG